MYDICPTFSKKSKKYRLLNSASAHNGSCEGSQSSPRAPAESNAGAQNNVNARFSAFKQAFVNTFV